LITGPSSNEKFDKHGKENPKEKNSEGHSDSHTEMDSRLLSVLLTVSLHFTFSHCLDFPQHCIELHNHLVFSQGVNRAFPFVSSNEADDIIDIQTPVLFQLVITKLKLYMRYLPNECGMIKYNRLILVLIHLDKNCNLAGSFKKF
jgi:ribosome biogenesis protein MAK21